MAEKRILVVDNEAAICRMLEAILTDSGYRVTMQTDSVKAVEEFKPDTFDLVITDIKMPRLDGLAVLKQIKERDPAVPVLMITAYATVEMSIQALREGAFDMLTKPFEPDELLYRVRNALRQTELLEENQQLREELAGQEQFGEVVGQSPELLTVLDTAKRVARRDIPVVITGESGTGKELVARAIHQHSSRSDQKFVAINCGALPEALLESELFGHRKGAFTGADREKKGLLEAANNGTLLLDEVGNLPLDVQKALLRFLQEKEFYRVGDSHPTRVDVRILSATNADLKTAIESGAFREDLYYRLAVVKLHLPPLRERCSDIPLLAAHFVREQNERFHTSVKGFGPRAMEALLGYSWPGNIRELKNLVEAALAIETGDRIRLQGLSRLMGEGTAVTTRVTDAQGNYAEALERFERGYFNEMLSEAEGNVEKAAARAGVNMATFYRKIKKYDLRSN